MTHSATVAALTTLMRLRSAELDHAKVSLRAGEAQVARMACERDACKAREAELLHAKSPSPASFDTVRAMQLADDYRSRNAERLAACRRELATREADLRDALDTQEARRAAVKAAFAAHETVRRRLATLEQETARRRRSREEEALEELRALGAGTPSDEN